MLRAYDLHGSFLERLAVRTLAMRASPGSKHDAYLLLSRRRILTIRRPIIGLQKNPASLPIETALGYVVIRVLATDLNHFATCPIHAAFIPVDDFMALRNDARESIDGHLREKAKDLVDKSANLHVIEIIVGLYHGFGMERKDGWVPLGVEL
jgi:hypothetical protein